MCIRDRHKAFLYSVPDLRNPLRHSRTNIRTSGFFFHSCRMEASPLCRCHVLRCGLHSSGHRTEEHESDCGIPDPQPGILHLRPGRVDHPRSETKYKRNPWMRHYVCRNYPRPAATKTRRIIFPQLNRAVVLTITTAPFYYLNKITFLNTVSLFVRTHR